MSKIFVFFILLATFSSCEITENTPIKKKNLNSALSELFGEIDSSSIVSSIGCYAGFYGHISEEYILKIPFSRTRYNNAILFNQNEIELNCELIIFEKDSAHLENICTDIIITNNPKPIRRINSTNGKFKIYIENDLNTKNNFVDRLYIKIQSVEFIDSLFNDKKIKIENKLIWGTPNLGIPG